MMTRMLLEDLFELLETSARSRLSHANLLSSLNLRENSYQYRLKGLKFEIVSMYEEFIDKY